MLNVDDIFKISTEEDFNYCSLEIFNYQYNGVDIYKKYVDILNIDVNKIKHYTQIPFLPIEFFKNYRIINKNHKPELEFKSSGTTDIQQRSTHFVASSQLYKKSIIEHFTNYFGNPEDYIFLGLLPNYIENKESSLIYMVNLLMNISNKPENGFYMYDFDKLNQTLQTIENNNKKAILFGVSYAILDFSEQYPIHLKNTLIVETGGMKGRKKELNKIELFNILRTNFKSDKIYSEYGMTELLSQGYSDYTGIYTPPKWKKYLLREIDNPLSCSKSITRGGVNIIDLANIYSSSFISTQDLGTLHNDNLFILGRIDKSDIRGCSLLYN